MPKMIAMEFSMNKVDYYSEKR